MGKTKYSRKNLVGKQKNNTLKKKGPKAQKGKKLKNNKKIKMKKKANKIKRKYSLKVKKQKGGAGVDPCSKCLQEINDEAIIVSKQNKGNCQKNSFEKKDKFCVLSNIKDESITNTETIPNAVVTPADESPLPTV